MLLNLPDTVVTSSAETLPAPVRELFEENRPLPPDTVFFEERFTTAMMVKRIGIAAVLFVIGAFLLLFSLEFLYSYHHVDPKYRQFIDFKEFVAGLVFIFCSWLMLASIRAVYTRSRRQAAGEHLRVGVFLLPDALVSHSSFDTTIIPRACFQGLSGNAVNYLFKNAPKSFNLPAEWVGALPANVHGAINAWGQTAPSPP